MNWKIIDPRFDIDKRATIVIVRNIEHPRYLWTSCVAQVETKNGWHIRTQFEEPYSYINEGDDWPENWMWSFVLIPEEVNKKSLPGNGLI